MQMTIYYNDLPWIFTDQMPVQAVAKGSEVVGLYTGPSDFTDGLYLLKHRLISCLVYWFEDSFSIEQELYRFFMPMQAAGGLVCNAQNEVLFIKRLGKWDLPKGKIEKNETPAVAAVREVEEECGIHQLQLQESLLQTFHIYEHHDQFILKSTHWYRMKYEGNESLVPQTEENISEVAWIHPNDFSIVFQNTYPSINDVLSRL